PAEAFVFSAAIAVVGARLGRRVAIAAGSVDAGDRRIGGGGRALAVVRRRARFADGARLRRAAQQHHRTARAGEVHALLAAAVAVEVALHVGAAAGGRAAAARAKQARAAALGRARITGDAPRRALAHALAEPTGGGLAAIRVRLAPGLAADVGE